MKQLNFSTESWHYKLASMVSYDPKGSDENGNEWGRDNADTCTYLRHVLGGAVLFTVVTIIFATVAHFAISLLFAIGFSIAFKAWIFTDEAMGTLIFTTIGAIVGISILSFNMIVRYVKRREAQRQFMYGDKSTTPAVTKPDGFVKSTYRSWKDKYCLQINFTDNESK